MQVAFSFFKEKKELATSLGFGHKSILQNSDYTSYYHNSVSGPGELGPQFADLCLALYELVMHSHRLLVFFALRK